MPLKKGWKYFINHPLDYILGTPEEDEPEPMQKKDNEYLLTHTRYIHLRRDYFIGLADDKKYKAKYDEPHIHCFLSKVSESFEQLIIYERPSDDSILRIVCHSPKKLQKVVILDHISHRDVAWIRNHAPHNANMVFPILYLSKLLKSSSYREIVFDQIAFNSFFVPFKDFASFQSIKHLNIRAKFENDYLDPISIATFIQFINSFSNLKSIDACLTLQILQPSASARQPLYQDSYDGFAFYEAMKKMKAAVFKDISEKVQGKIHFGAKINSFRNMCCSMKNNLTQSSKSLKPPIEYNEAIIERKFRLHHDALQIEFSITPAS